ncbi:MAG: hypothetical protein ACRD0B_10925, partial [Acidimicrobiales bacterium]
MATKRSSSAPQGAHQLAFEAEATAPEESWPGEIGGPPIEVRTSARRRKSSAAFFEGGRIVVVVPEGLSESQT